jgi:hypothetical protein
MLESSGGGALFSLAINRSGRGLIVAALAFRFSLGSLFIGPTDVWSLFVETARRRQVPGGATFLCQWAQCF